MILCYFKTKFCFLKYLGLSKINQSSIYPYLAKKPQSIDRKIGLRASTVQATTWGNCSS